MTLDELYRAKGEAITQIEIWEAKLKSFNTEIVSILNKAIESTESVDKKEAK